MRPDRIPVVACSRKRQTSWSCSAQQFPNPNTRLCAIFDLISDIPAVFRNARESIKGGRKFRRLDLALPVNECEQPLWGGSQRTAGQVDQRARARKRVLHKPCGRRAHPFQDAGGIASDLPPTHVERRREQYSVRKIDQMAVRQIAAAEPGGY